MMGDDASTAAALPDDAVLVHIGMHKTGTTAVQSLFADNRAALREQGVHYPGWREAHHLEARSLTQRDVGPGGADKAPPIQVWDDLAAEIRLEPGRVLLSSEFFSGARGDQPAKLVRDVGPERARIVVGIRNLTLTAVSNWQQTLKQGRISDINRWAVNNIPRDGKPAREAGSWEQWDLAAMVRRWAEAAGPDRVTVVVIDSNDRSRLPATFERLLELEPGLLTGQQPGKVNRGMTAPEAELVRQLNIALRGRLSWDDYRRIVRQGVIRSLVESRTPGSEEPRPTLPPWAQDETEAAGKRAAEDIRALGVPVVGDLGALHEPGEPRPEAAAAASLDGLPMEVAVQAILGAVYADPRTPVPVVRGRRVEDLSARELTRVLGGRVRRRAARAARRLRR